MTTKRGCTTDPTGEEAREKKLMEQDQYFGAVLKGDNERQASITRFDPSSKGRALEIIKPHLKRKFAPLISRQMVDPQGPMLSLGETNAGSIVADHLEELKKLEGEKEELAESRQLLARRFDVMLFEKYKNKRDKLLREQKLHKAGRWAVRTVIVGGAIAATVVKFGPGASAFALEPVYEKYASQQEDRDQAKMEKLKKEYQKENKVHISDTGGYRSEWLRDRNVKSMSDLSDRYSLMSSSSTHLSAVDTVSEVATDLGSFAIKNTSIP